MMWFEVCFLGSNLFGTLWASWTSWKSISFARLGKFSIIFSNKFSISCSSSSPSDTPMIRMLEHLKLSWRFLNLSSFFWILVSSLHSGWMFISSFCYKLLVWVPVSFLSLLLPCIFFFIALCIAFTFPLFCIYSTISVTILITSVLNCASDRLAISSLLSCIFSGALKCSVIWAIFFFFCLGTPAM